MSVQTILLDFSINSSLIKNDTSLSVLSSNIEEVIREFLVNLKLLSSIKLNGSLVKIFTADKGVLVNLRVFSEGLITVNIDYFKSEQDEPLINYQRCQSLRDVIKKQVEVTHDQVLPPLTRSHVNRYFRSSDDRLLEYDIDELIFEESTPYQKVQILHSKSLGNMLLLDDLQNIAESDLIYTETLMQRGKENYANKEIVILGGGDGALLYELLKENPREVIMLEIDEVVMKACAKYIRSICGEVLDKYEGPNYKIIVGDCMKALEQFAIDGRTFDYIFGDLTDVPISPNQSQELWSFINKVLQASFKILKADGKYMTHVMSGTISFPEILELINLNVPVRRGCFTETSYVPFHRTNYGASEPIARLLRLANNLKDVDIFKYSNVQVLKKKVQIIDLPVLLMFLFLLELLMVAVSYYFI